MSDALIAGLSQQRLMRVRARERETYLAAHPNCIATAARSSEHWLNGVPMHWMTDWALPVPLVVKQAREAVLEDIDGHLYADFCLGDTGSMFGHSPPAIAKALAEQAQHGLTCMLPSEATARAGELLAQRFSLPFWQMTQTATDAN
ncbi:MAG: aminotransferase class III-fold pyridoxal phosphate-dependent enzyme, partial [Povalibacter sp.]